LEGALFLFRRFDILGYIMFSLSAARFQLSRSFLGIMFSSGTTTLLIIMADFRLPLPHPQAS
jgi:hypothetical protein